MQLTIIFLLIFANSAAMSGGQGISIIEDNTKSDLNPLPPIPSNEIGLNDFPQNDTFVAEDFNVIEKLRDNENAYTEIYNPWKTRAANHVAAVTEDGEFMAVGGGYLLDTEVHIYRWNVEIDQYEKVYEAGSGEIKGDVFDLAFGDLDNNGLLDLVAVSGDGFVYVFEQAFLYDPFESLENRFDLVWKSEKLFQAKSVDISDIDLDGILDIVVGSWDSRVHVYEYTDHSGYPFAREHWIEFEETWVSEELEGRVESVETGDFNGNGLPDIIAGTFTGELYIFENDGVLVPTPNGELTPLPNDDDYIQIWSQIDTEKTIWNIIGSIEAEDVDEDGYTDAVIMGWGQGAWVLKYTQQRGFYLEQLIVPFESWEEQGFYPLDYFGDRMVVDVVDPFLTATNLFIDTPSRSQSSCNVIEEPSGDGTCYNVLTNSAATDAPDGVYTEFRPNSTHTAYGVWDIGVGEELASNGNSDPDLYIVMPAGQVTPEDWNITLSNNLEQWFTVDPSNFQVVSGSEGDALAVNLDVLYSQRQIESTRYLRLELINQNAQGDVDGFIIPYPARPLTLAVSANIYPLNFLSNGLFTIPSEKIIFGGTDGRLIVFDKIAHTQVSIRDKSSIMNTVTIDDDDYGLKLQTWSQIWDSFKDDQFKTDETIWSIYPTPKGTIVPIWRYYSGGPMDDFSVNNIGSGTEKVHFMQSHNIHPFYSGTELIVSSNDTSELFVFSDFYENSPTDVTTFSNLFFDEINLYDFDPSGPDKILTFAFGEFDSDDYLEEIITFAWYKDPTTLGTTLSYDQYLMPLIWRWDGGDYDNEVPLVEETDQLYNFLINSFTYPSADTGDFNGDGLTDIVISNGRLAMLWNTGTANNPKFKIDLDYFSTLNEKAVSLPIYQPDAWDYDNDGDFDILYSYGRDNNSRQRYGLDFFENSGTAEIPNYERTPEIVKNPTLTGSFFANDFTYGTTDTDTSSDATAYAIWVYNPTTHRVRQAFAEIGKETSFIVGSNPEIKKLEVNKAQTNTYINYGYTVTESWNNRYEYADWTMTLEAGELDGDDTKEIVISDFDNNVYVFENLVNNTYKRAFKTFDLNHTLTSDSTPYVYDGIEGLQGKFTRTIFDHGAELIIDIDLNNNGLKEFIIIADLSIYIFENTGFNDAYNLIFERDYGQEVRLSDLTYDIYVDEFSAVAYTPDFDGRGPMIALGADYQLFLLRYSPDVGFLESFAHIDNNLGITGMFGTSSFPHSLNHINTLRFADINQDGATELWAGGYSNQLFSEITNGFVVALESNYSDYAQVYSFSTDFTTSNPVNTLEFDDLDYDGQLELLIGHSFGVDIYEAAIGSSFDFTRVSIISSDPGYGATEAQEVFGTINSPDPLGARKHDMIRLSNDNYVVVVGEDQVSSNSFDQFDDNPTTGELRFDLTPNPVATEMSDYTTRVGSDPLNTGGLTNSGWERVVIWESEPSIIESGSAGSSYIAWISYSTYYFGGALQYSGTPRYNVHIREINSVGTPGTEELLLENGLAGPLKSPSIALQPSDTTDILLGFVYYNTFYAYDINFGAGGVTFSVDAAVSSYSLDLDYYFHSVDLMSDITSGRIGIAFSAKAWNGGVTEKIYYAEYTDFITLSEFQGVWQLNTDRTQEFYPSILAMPQQLNNIIVMYERVQGSIFSIATSFSSDSGRSWSDYSTGFTKNPNLTQIDEFTYETLEGKTVYPKQFSPQLTIDTNGQIEYQFVERFVIAASSGGDSNYNQVTFSITFFSITFDYQFATQMFTGTFENSNFFDFAGILNVRDIAVGDSDRDGRKELFLSHGSQVSLLEISSTSQTILEFRTKFQSQRYLRETGGVEIFDTNSNGIPELIYTVKGGDVIFLELTDLRQPFIGDYYITSLTDTSDTNAVTSVDHVVAVNIDADEGTEYVIASISSSGTIKLIDDDGTQIEETSLGSIESLYFEDNTIIAMTATTIHGLDIGLTEIYNYQVHSYGDLDNHVIRDIDSDGIREFIFVQNTTIIAIEISNGAIIFQEQLSNAEINGFTDLSTTILDGKQYYSVATQDSDRFTTHLLNENGTLVTSESIFYFNVTSDRLSHEIGDFDGDGEIEITVLRYNQATESFIQTYDLVDQNLFSGIPVTNITLPAEGTIPSAAPDILSLDTRGDGIMDIIFWTNQANQAIDLPALSSSALLAIDVSSTTVIWYRTFEDPIDQIKLQDLGDSGNFIIRTDTLGTYVLNQEGVDLLWLDTNTLTSDVSLVDLPDTIGAVAVRVTGLADIFTTTGKFTARQNIITPKENKVISETIQYYRLSGTVLTSYSKPVDINRDGAYDLFVGFSNGTFALRSHKLGEYWRVDVNDINTVHAEAIRYAPNQNGLAISYDPGYLVIFDRISTRTVIKVSNSLGGIEIMDMKPLSPDGKIDYLLIRTKIDSSTTGFHLFNPIQERFVWNYTTGGIYEKFEIAYLDNTKPNYPTHIVYGIGTISLIQLPTTLLPSGQLPDANDGSTWIDYEVRSNEDGLSTFYLVSSSGDFANYTYRSGTTALYQEQDLSLTGITHFSMHRSGSTFYYLFEQATKSHLYIDDGILNYILNFSQPIFSTDELNLITDLYGDTTPEILLYARNELAIYNITGDLQELRSFSSSAVSRQLWLPDSSGDPVLLTDVFNENIELIDPINRNFSRSLATVSVLDIDDFILEEPGEFIPPEAIWPEYIPPINEGKRNSYPIIWITSLIGTLVTIPIVIRRFRQ